jgi:hypothetical protein
MKHAGRLDILNSNFYIMCEKNIKLTTLTLLCNNFLQMARPIPPAPPVTKATLSAESIMRSACLYLEMLFNFGSEIYNNTSEI